MGILNIGSQALQANLVALQTIGNNIANVNTQGYSRQNVSLATVQGQYTGNGYVGKGVTVQTITRNYDQFLDRQSTLASATQASDAVRTDYLKQLSSIFQGGTNGIGQSINDMLNSFSDVASTPTDITARTVALTQVDETSRRLREASQSLDDLQTGITQSLNEKINSVNSIAKQIADVNGKIALAQSSGQPPNDLLDQRDQLVRNLNQYVQTTSLPASDGSIGIFIGGSQSLVLGNQAATMSLVKDDFSNAQQSKIAITRGGVSVSMDENTLGGGQVSGLLRFQNSDLVEGRNLLGRLTTSVTTAMNTQHQLGLDLNGNPGANLFTPVSVDNVLQPVAPATVNAGTADLHLAISDSTKFVASDYEITFTSGTAGTIKRTSDGTTQNFDLASPPVVVDGLTISNAGGNAVAGDRFYLKPFSSAANSISREFSNPAALAVASPVVGKMGTNNTGSLQLSSLTAGVNPPTNVPVTITFTSSNSYTRSDVAGTFTYTSGQAIQSGDTPNSWTLTLQGSPKSGDTFDVRSISDPSLNLDLKLNGGNATNIMNLRDVPTFDGAAMSDGYAGLISQIGVRAQSASYASQVSSSIATTAEQNRTAVSGVNLDEEASKLLQYQQAYQASAKMVQVAQSIFDTLIQTLGA
ncbi:flagellar hook-associated protein FlgK [Rhodoferax sp. GW822-FHT02A01]|uniref:flagellar hook-associated protein FlgK n=1 Tax=Rhodoferax sp. GW822-FHT02A01 TaxID=3141537 RepID=UPI00315CD1CE